MGFGGHGDKNSPMCTMKYTAVFFYVVGLCWRSCTSCLDTWHHGFYQIPTDKKKKWLSLLEILEDPNMANYNHTIIQTQTLK